MWRSCHETPSWRRHVPSEAQGRIRTDARAGPPRSREARGDSPGFRTAGFGSSSSPAAAEDVRPGAPRQSGSRCAGNACPPGAGQHRAAGGVTAGEGARFRCQPLPTPSAWTLPRLRPPRPCSPPDAAAHAFLCAAATPATGLALRSAPRQVCVLYSTSRFFRKNCFPENLTWAK